MPSGPKRRRAAKNKTNGNSSVNHLLVPKVEPVDDENALEYSVKIENGLAVKTEPVPVDLVEQVVESPGVGLVEPVAESSSVAEVGLVEQVVESPGVDLVESAVVGLDHEPVVESFLPVVGLDEPIVESPVTVVGLDHEPVVESFLPVVGLDEPIVESPVAVVGLDYEPVVDSYLPVVGQDEPLVESSVAVVGRDEPVVESCAGGCIECWSGIVVDDTELLSEVNGDLQALLVEHGVHSIDEILEGPRALEEVSSVYELVNSNGVFDATLAEENGSVQQNSCDSGVKLTNVELGDVKKSIEEQIRIVEQVTFNLRQILANFD